MLVFPPSAFHPLFSPLQEHEAALPLSTTLQPWGEASPAPQSQLQAEDSRAELPGESLEMLLHPTTGPHLSLLPMGLTPDAQCSISPSIPNPVLLSLPSCRSQPTGNRGLEDTVPCF